MCFSVSNKMFVQNCSNFSNLAFENKVPEIQFWSAQCKIMNASIQSKYLEMLCTASTQKLFGKFPTLVSSFKNTQLKKQRINGQLILRFSSGSISVWAI